MIWRLRDLPELQHLSPQERARLLAAILPRGYYVKLAANAVARSIGLTLGLYLLVFTLDTIFEAATGHPLIPQTLASENLVAASGLLFFAAGCPAMYLFVLHRVRGQVRDALRQAELAGHQLPVCPDCAYGLDGVHAEHCPECGRPLLNT